VHALFAENKVRFARAEQLWLEARAYAIRCRHVARHQLERSEPTQQHWRAAELRAHADDAVAGDVLRRRVVSGTVVHRAVSVLRQTRLRSVQRLLQRADAVQQSPAARPHHPQDQAASASHRRRLQALFTGVSSKDSDSWRSGCRQ